MTENIGHIIALAGSEMTLSMNTGEAVLPCTIDDVVIVMSPANIVGLIRSIDRSAAGQVLVHVDLVGELHQHTFSRGIAAYPPLNTTVRLATDEERNIIYGEDSPERAKIGTLYNNDKQVAYVDINKFLAGHFALLGTSGVGKSSSVALLINSFLEKMPQGHIIILDPHNEYTPAFLGKSHLLNADNISMPYWLLDFEESVRIFVQGGTREEQETQASILHEAILYARKEYYKKEDASWITVDSPTPYRIIDVFQWFDQEIGKFNRVESSTPYLRLKARIQTLQNDRRLSFMFPTSVRDGLAMLLGKMLRIPVGDHPVTLIDLSGMPSEVVDVIVSVIFRVIFDFCVWSDRSQTPPIMLVCEEAHRYIPSDIAESFVATTRAISRIAKEGRKYGLSLGLITQRPSELSQSVLSQCGTLCILRMGNEADHRFVENILPEGAKSLLQTVTSLATREAIVVGEGVSMPMRIMFDYLAEEKRPHSTSSDFVTSWQTDVADTFMTDSIHRWRHQIRKTHSSE